MRPYLTEYFACGKEAAEWLFGKKLASKAVILPNAIDTKRYQFSERIRKEMREQLGISPQTMVICHVGSFVKAKNHQFIISIFKHLHDQVSNALLLLIGDGELRASIEQQVQVLSLENHVRFLGIRSDVNKWLMAADVFLFPSIHEGLPMSLVEAQCSGLPCVVSDVVPQEACMTDLITRLPINNKEAKWAETIIHSFPISYDRSSYVQQIAGAGYDIRQNVKVLQNLYLR